MTSGLRRRELVDHVGVALLAGLHLLVSGHGDAGLFERALQRLRDRDRVVLGRVVGDRDRLGAEPAGQRLRGDRGDLVGHRLQGEAEAVGRGVRGQPDRHQAGLDVERQGFDADAGVVGADDAVEAGGDRGLRRLHSRRRVGGVVDRDDFDLLAEDPAAGVELRRRQFGALQHPLAEDRLFAGERRLEPDPERVRAAVVGAGASTARRDEGEGGEDDRCREPGLVWQGWPSFRESVRCIGVCSRGGASSRTGRPVPVLIQQAMQSWDLKTVEAEPHQPQILASADDARTIVLRLPAGEELQEHEVHERARLVVVDGEVDVTTRRRRDRAGRRRAPLRVRPRRAPHDRRPLRCPPAADPHPVARRRPSRAR